MAETGLYFKLTDGTLTKVGPALVNTNAVAPNSAPAGSTGNAIGEQWFDGRAAFASPVMKVWNGSSWQSAGGFVVDDATGDFTLNRELTVRSLVGTGTGANGYFRIPQGPSTDESAITPAEGMIRYDTTTGLVRFYNGTAWGNIGDASGQDLTLNNLTVLGNTILGNDCGTDTLTVTAVSQFNCDVTVGTTNSTNFTVASATDFQSGVDITLQSDLRFHAGSTATNYVGFQAPASIPGSVLWTLPNADGAAGEVLSTDGAGNLSWGEGGGGASVTVSDTAPTGAEMGDLWYDSTTGRTFVYYDEAALNPPVGTDAQWVDASPNASGAASIVQIDDISSGFNGSQTTFALNEGGSPQSPASVTQLIIDLGGVIQRPGTDYTVNGSTITFTTAPQLGLTFNGRIFGQAVTLNTVASGAVTESKIANNAVTGPKIATGAVETAKLADNSISTGGPKLIYDASLVPTGTTQDLGSESNPVRTVYASSLNGSNAPFGMRNILINPSGRLIQRGVGTRAGVAYHFDRWQAYCFSDPAANVTSSSQFDSALGYIQEYTFAAGRGAVQQRVLASNHLFTAAANGAKVTMSGRLACSAATCPGAASLTWVRNNAIMPGTVATFKTISGRPSAGLTNHPDEYWTATFTLPALPAGYTYQSGDSLQFAVSELDNIGAQYQLADMQLEYGAVATRLERRDLLLELEMCRFYYNVGTAYGAVYSAGPGLKNYDHLFYPQMRTTPTMTLANVSLVNATGATISAGLAEAYLEGTSTLAGDSAIGCTWFADAEL